MKKELYDQIQIIERTHWWYVARRKIVFDWIWQVLDRYADPRVLDVGCGTGFNVEYVGSRGYDRVVGLDLSTQALSFGRSRNLSLLVCGNGLAPPFQRGAFDAIVALDLLEHMEDDTQALARFEWLLGCDGSLVLFVPAFRFLWGLQDEVSYHKRRYTAPELAQKIESVGLDIEKLTYVNMFLFPLVWLGRMLLRLVGYRTQSVSENDLHPGWSNGLLQAIFAAERPLLRRMNLPFGVSILCVARKSAQRGLS
jgi:SAM-dependent methyltransferase